MNRRAFTLVELLVVLSIIGLLSSVAVVAMNNTRAGARDAKRAADLSALRNAMELYFADNNSYPVATAWYGGTGNCFGTVTDNWIPGLSPDYMKKLPLDPKPVNCSTVYLYGSNGTDYKIIAHVPEYCENPNMINIKDPARDGGPNGSIVDGTTCWGWAIYTQGAAGW
jgi:prepilin-type N-terminal cleavage/methylation domain-containing protein